MDVIKIRTHKELSDVAEKYWGFTFRQWIFLALTAVIVVPLYIYTKPIIGDELASWIVILIGGPLLSCGFLTLQGLKADRLFLYLKRHYIYFYKPLEYKTEKEIIAEKEAKKNKSKQKEKKEKKVKITRAEKKLKKRTEKEAKKKMQMERRQKRELAKAKKLYGDLDQEKEKLKEIEEKQAVPDTISYADIQNIIELGKRLESQMKNERRDENVLKEGSEGKETEERKEAETKEGEVEKGEEREENSKEE